jgi:hypothetical protein
MVAIRRRSARRVRWSTHVGCWRGVGVGMVGRAKVVVGVAWLWDMWLAAGDM